MLLSQDSIDKLRKAVEENRISLITFDIETSYELYRLWGTGEQYVSVDNLVEGTESRILTIQYIKGSNSKSKYLKSTITYPKNSNSVIKFPIIDDSQVLKEFIPVVNSAQIVVGQNSKTFDKRVIQRRLKDLQLPPINIDFMIDIFKCAKTSFRENSYKLDNRSKKAGLGGKNKMEMKDWIDVVENQVPLEAKMLPYGCKDSEDTMELFWYELPYYELPGTTISKINRLIQDAYPENKPKCLRCEEAKKAKYDVYKTISRGTPVYKCRNCQEMWELEHV